MLDKSYECLGIFKIKPKLKPQSQAKYTYPHYTIQINTSPCSKQPQNTSLPKSPKIKQYPILRQRQTVNIKPKDTLADQFTVTSIRTTLNTRQKKVLTQTKQGRAIFTQHQHSRTCSTPKQTKFQTQNVRPQTYEYNRNLFKANANLTHKIVNYEKYQQNLQRQLKSYKRKNKFVLNDIWSKEYQES